MKVEFESSSEEQEKIVDYFENEVSQYPIKSIDDLYEIITNICALILKDAQDSVLMNCTKCVENALENSSVYQALLEQFNGSKNNIVKTVEDYKISKEDEFIDKWNELIKNKQYLVIDNSYKS